MTQHPIHTLPPEQLRGYALGLRESAARMNHANPFSIQSTRTELLREAALVEGFAARLDAAPEAILRPRHLYWPPGIDESEAVEDIEDALQSVGYVPLLEPAPLRSTRWPGTTRWAVRVPTCDGDTEVEFFDTPEEADAFVASAEDAPHPDTFPLPTETAAELETLIPNPAEPTAEEQAQTGLADAVADSLAQPAAIELTPEQVLATAAEAKAAFRADHPELQARTRRASHAEACGARPWTAARLALLAELFPTAIKIEDLRTLLNELPGDLLATEAAIRVKAAKIGHSRQGLPIPPEYQGARLSRTRFMTTPCPAGRGSCTPPTPMARASALRPCG
jgi:hypothetical protein